MPPPASRTFVPDFMPVLAAAVVALAALASPLAAADRPNILWLTSEDHGPQLGCYGDPIARTPYVDALAAKGMLYRHAWSNAPVCAPARTTIVSGLFAPSAGAGIASVTATCLELLGYTAPSELAPSLVRFR